VNAPRLEADPYRYLEDSADPRTVAWTREQNARTRASLDAAPDRDALIRRFDVLVRGETFGVRVPCGERTFVSYRPAGAEQVALYVADGAGERPLIEPATLDPSGLTALDWWYPSPRGTYVAFGLSRNGDERSTLYVLDVATGERLADAIPGTRHCSLAWEPGETAFYYTRYPADSEYDVRGYRHVLGEPWERDERIAGEGRRPEEWLALALSAGGRYLTATFYDGWARSDVYVADTARTPLRFQTVVEGRAALHDVDPGDRALYLRSGDGAARFRVFEIAPEALDRAAWREIVPEGEHALEAIALTRHGLLLRYLENVRCVVRLHRHDGSVEVLPQAPERSVVDWYATEASSRVELLEASFLEPPSARRFDVGERGTAEGAGRRAATPFDPSAYRTEQRWFVSRDGTRVPMTTIAKATTPQDGTAPAVLYGYGGFNVSLLPSFVPDIVPWLDAGGVYAIANLRGGGEFGEAWHRAGMRERKQNVFDDFAAAALYLGGAGLADPARIALVGGSNGGLLVAALATQRPELARAIVCLVPLTDMLRFPDFLIARLWIAEYGDPADPSDAAVLRAYSPYHNVRDGVPYPAMLIASAEDDTRVDPMHARKFGARVQAATASGLPVYVHVEPNAGHGAGKPRRKVVAELADRWSFIGRELGQRLA
jgi:prolyl oligopeptidase